MAESSDQTTRSEEEPSTETALPSLKKIARHIRTPDRVGPFKIFELLGEGGMGKVYEAEQDSTDACSPATHLERPKGYC